jgi:hypothetical protein
MTTAIDNYQLTPGPWCYAVFVQIADRAIAPALVQVVIPPLLPLQPVPPAAP